MYFINILRLTTNIYTLGIMPNIIIINSCGQLRGAVTPNIILMFLTSRFYIDINQ